MFLISTISAIGAPGGDVLSAVIYNYQNVPIQCALDWQTFSGGPRLDREMIIIDSMQYTVVDENIFDMGTWKANAFMRKIECGGLVLAAPFEGLARQEQLWQFRVEPNKIVSVGPNSKKS